MGTHISKWTCKHKMLFLSSNAYINLREPALLTFPFQWECWDQPLIGTKIFVTVAHGGQLKYYPKPHWEKNSILKTINSYLISQNTVRLDTRIEILMDHFWGLAYKLWFIVLLYIFCPIQTFAFKKYTKMSMKMPS